jgi:hypothetical protein
MTYGSSGAMERPADQNGSWVPGPSGPRSNMQVLRNTNGQLLRSNMRAPASPLELSLDVHL